MARLVFFIATLSSIIIVLSLLGVIQGSTMGVLFTLISDPSKFFSSDFFTESWTTVATLIVGAGVAIGLLVSGKADMAVKAPLAAILLPIGHDIIALYTTLVSYGTVSYWLGLLFVSPLAVLFVLAVVDWWGGTD